MVKQISDNEIYLLIKYIKSVLWRVVKCLSYIQDAQCLKFNYSMKFFVQKITTGLGLNRVRSLYNGVCAINSCCVLTDTDC